MSTREEATTCSARARPCSVISLRCHGKSKDTDEWTGTISELSSSNHGWGVLSVKLTDGITVETMNNGLSDSGYKSLIDPSSDLFKTVSKMYLGEPI